MRTLAIIQARLGSTRLPRKVLCDLNGAPLLRRVVERVNRADLDGVVVAIPETPENNELFLYAKARGWTVSRGSEEDVLGRYAEAAVEHSADVIVRVTSDEPFIDPGVVNVVAQHIRDGADFAQAGMDGTWPIGLDVQAFTAELLRRADEEAMSPFDREHVVPWMDRADVRKVNVTAPPELADYKDVRLTVDTQTDLILARSIYQGLSGLPFFTTQDVLELLDRRPELWRVQ